MTPETKYKVGRGLCFLAALLFAGGLVAMAGGWVSAFMGAAVPVMTKLRDRPVNDGVMPVYAIPEQK